MKQAAKKQAEPTRTGRPHWSDAADEVRSAISAKLHAGLPGEALTIAFQNGVVLRSDELSCPITARFGQLAEFEPEMAASYRNKNLARYDAEQAALKRAESLTSWANGAPHPGEAQTLELKRRAEERAAFIARRVPELEAEALAESRRLLAARAANEYDKQQNTGR